MHYCLMLETFSASTNTPGIFSLHKKACKYLFPVLSYFYLYVKIIRGRRNNINMYAITNLGNAIIDRNPFLQKKKRNNGNTIFILSEDIK